VLQALHRQVAKLQLVVQDMQADAETKSRESTDSLLHLKLQHEQACAAIARQYENAAEEVRSQLKQMVTHAEDLSSKLAKSERIRVQNGELHHEEMRIVKTSLAMEQVSKTTPFIMCDFNLHICFMGKCRCVPSLMISVKQCFRLILLGQADKRLLEAEVKKLKGKKLSPELAHSCVISSTNVSKDGRTKLRCKGCGELMHVFLDDRDTKQGGGQQEEENHEKVQQMKDEIDKLKSALGLALEAEQQARKEAERFTLSSQQACETLQDRIASQLSRVADAEAEKAMAIALQKHESAKVIVISRALPYPWNFVLSTIM
jgi:hypothetical protein